VARRFVWSRNLENEEAKARYRAVKNTTTMGCNARKTNNYVLEKQASCGNNIPLQYVKQKRDTCSNILFIFSFVGGN
jgi:hypothetical protein